MNQQRCLKYGKKQQKMAETAKIMNNSLQHMSLIAPTILELEKSLKNIFFSKFKNVVL